MKDKKWIILGLVVFVGLFTFPFWFNVGKAAPAPEVVLSEKALEAKDCVMTKEFMKTEHMHLLDVWRLKVVRDGVTEFVNADGKAFDMSLSNTCLDCHSNKEQFCDRCHDYASVKPYCWDCHIENPKGDK
jgi:hypothetical protein